MPHLSRSQMWPDTPRHGVQKTSSDCVALKLAMAPSVAYLMRLATMSTQITKHSSSHAGVFTKLFWTRSLPWCQSRLLYREEFNAPKLWLQLTGPALGEFKRWSCTMVRKGTILYPPPPISSRLLRLPLSPRPALGHNVGAFRGLQLEVVREILENLSLHPLQVLHHPRTSHSHQAPPKLKPALAAWSVLKPF